MAKKIGSLTLYSVDDLSEMLGVSKMTLRSYLREGRIKGRKLGVSWYVTEEAIRDYFEQPEPDTTTKGNKAGQYYIVQGVNDLVSETEHCETIGEVLETLGSQPIISLFQVQVVDSETHQIKNIIKAREFLEKYAKA